jgi:rhodanese-related sulfurtransferase
VVSDMGFEKVYHLKGGIRQWQGQGLALVKPQ